MGKEQCGRGESEKNEKAAAFVPFAKVQFPFPAGAPLQILPARETERPILQQHEQQTFIRRQAKEVLVECGTKYTDRPNDTNHFHSPIQPNAYNNISKCAYILVIEKNLLLEECPTHTLIPMSSLGPHCNI